GEGEVEVEAFSTAVHAYLARSNALITIAQIDDITAETDPVNVPATSDERPNWKRRLSVNRGSAGIPAAAEAVAGVPQRTGVAVTPRATYRLQFRKEFGFADAAEIAPYLARLGVSHVYASPWLKARPGSTHGYDIVDHHAINPELGTEADFRRM